MLKTLALTLVLTSATAEVVRMPMKKLSNHDYIKQKRAGNGFKKRVVGDTGSVGKDIFTMVCRKLSFADIFSEEGQSSSSQQGLRGGTSGVGAAALWAAAHAF